MKRIVSMFLMVSLIVACSPDAAETAIAVLLRQMTHSPAQPAQAILAQQMMKSPTPSILRIRFPRKAPISKRSMRRFLN